MQHSPKCLDHTETGQAPLSHSRAHIFLGLDVQEEEDDHGFAAGARVGANDAWGDDDGDTQSTTVSLEDYTARTSSGRPVLPPAAAASAPAPPWDCPECTFMNLGERSQCEMCDMVRSVVATTPAPLVATTPAPLTTAEAPSRGAPVYVPSLDAPRKATSGFPGSRPGQEWQHDQLTAQQGSQRPPGRAPPPGLGPKAPPPGLGPKAVVGLAASAGAGDAHGVQTSPTPARATPALPSTLLRLSPLGGKHTQLPPLVGAWDDGDDEVSQSSRMPRIDPLCVPLDALQVIHNLILSGWSARRQHAITTAAIVTAAAAAAVKSRGATASRSDAAQSDHLPDTTSAEAVPAANPTAIRRPPGLGPPPPAAEGAAPVIVRSSGTASANKGAADVAATRDEDASRVHAAASTAARAASGMTKPPSLFGRVLCLSSGTSLRVYPAFVSAIDAVRLLASSVSPHARGTVFAFDTPSPDGVVLAAQGKPRGGGRDTQAPAPRAKPPRAAVVGDRSVDAASSNTASSNAITSAVGRPPALAPPAPLPLWGCPACTYVNLGEHDRCEMCEIVRSDAIATAAAAAAATLALSANAPVASRLTRSDEEADVGGDEDEGGGGAAGPDARAVVAPSTPAHNSRVSDDISATYDDEGGGAATRVDPPARRLYVVDLGGGDANVKGAAAESAVADQGSTARAISGASHEADLDQEDREPSRMTSAGRRKRGAQ
jgi:hypothetical protein